jgi:hypothetical protein
MTAARAGNAAGPSGTRPNHAIDRHMTPEGRMQPIPSFRLLINQADNFFNTPKMIGMPATIPGLTRKLW